MKVAALSSAAMSTAAARMRAHRRREADGYGIVQVKVKLIALSEFLIESELLDVSCAEDRKAMGRSIEKLLELLITARRLRDV